MCCLKYPGKQNVLFQKNLRTQGRTKGMGWDESLLHCSYSGLQMSPKSAEGQYFNVTGQQIEHSLTCFQAAQHTPVLIYQVGHPFLQPNKGLQGNLWTCMRALYQ